MSAVVFRPSQIRNSAARGRCCLKARQNALDDDLRFAAAVGSGATVFDDGEGDESCWKYGSESDLFLAFFRDEHVGDDYVDLAAVERGDESGKLLVSEADLFADMRGEPRGQLHVEAGQLVVLHRSEGETAARNTHHQRAVRAGCREFRHLPAAPGHPAVDHVGPDPALADAREKRVEGCA
jgi:hypothetical protein